MCTLTPMTDTPRKLITRQQAADRAGVNLRTIDRWRRLNLLRSHTFRGLQVTVWIDPADLDALLHPAVPAQRKRADA